MIKVQPYHNQILQKILQNPKNAFSKISIKALFYDLLVTWSVNSVYFRSRIDENSMVAAKKRYMEIKLSRFGWEFVKFFGKDFWESFFNPLKLCAKKEEEDNPTKEVKEKRLKITRVEQINGYCEKRNTQT